MESLRIGRHCEERSDEAIHSVFPRGDGLLRCARNDEETPSLNRLEVTHLVGDLGGNRRGPWRAAPPLDVDFHPEGFPSSGRPDAVHGGGTLDASRMRGIEKHERFGAASDLLDFLPQQTAI